jgi:hypothetical protein
MLRNREKLPNRILLAGFFVNEAKRRFFFEPARLLQGRGVKVQVLEHGRDVDHDLPTVYAPAHIFRQPARSAGAWKRWLRAFGFAMVHPRTCFDCVSIDFLVIGQEKQYAGKKWKQWIAILNGLVNTLWQISNGIGVVPGDLVISFGSNYPWQRLLQKLCSKRIPASLI